MTTPSKHARPSLSWTRINIWLLQIFAVTEADIRKLRHDPIELFTRMIQPAIWLLIFGQSMARLKPEVAENIPFLDYMAPGILAQSVLFVSIFYGIALIWERDIGILQKILVSPAPRVSLVMGRAIAAGIRCLSQILVIYLISFSLSIKLRYDPLALLGVFFTIMLGGALFSTLSLIVASIVKKRERFMGIGQVITMPLFFASNALYPIDIMPKAIRYFSLVNPLTYMVDALRTLMIANQTSVFGLGTDYLVLVLVFALLVAIGTRLYPKILY
jgi:ABC-2 type transport system permease protein